MNAGVDRLRIPHMMCDPGMDDHGAPIHHWVTTGIKITGFCPIKPYRL